MDEFLAAVIQLYTVYHSLLIFVSLSMYLAKAYGHTRILTELQWEFWLEKQMALPQNVTQKLTRNDLER